MPPLAPRRSLAAALLLLATAACGEDSPDPVGPGNGNGNGNGNGAVSVSNPMELGRIVTRSAAGFSSAAVHNALWYHDPVDGSRRYVFVGEEQEGAIGASSAGDIHVVDISNVAQPKEVAFLNVAGAGTHNFSVDEPRGILYAAYYNGGVQAINVRGDLGACTADQKDVAGRCDLAKMGRVVAVGLLNAASLAGMRAAYVWGVHYENDVVYASDMQNALWKLRAVDAGGAPVSGGAAGAPCATAGVAGTPQTMTVLGCGRYDARTTAEVFVRGNTAYTTTWGNGNRGSALLVWDVAGAPTLVDSVVVGATDATTFGDVAVSPDGRTLVVATEQGPLALLVYDLANARKPVEIARVSTPGWRGAHTAELGVIDGKLHAFLAQYPNGGGVARVTAVDLSTPSSPKIVLTRDFPGTTVHDTYYRNGLLFVAAWGQGLVILDLTGKKGQ